MWANYVFLTLLFFIFLFTFYSFGENLEFGSRIYLTLSPPDGPYSPTANTVNISGGRVQNIVYVLMAVFYNSLRFHLFYLTMLPPEKRRFLWVLGAKWLIQMSRFLRSLYYEKCEFKQLFQVFYCFHALQFHDNYLYWFSLSLAVMIWST